MAKTTTYEDRYQIMKMSMNGVKDRQIAQELNLAISTVRKWRRRARQPQADSLISRMGRPKKGILSTYSEAVSGLLYQLRDDHSGWGAKTLRYELEELNWPIEDIPAISSIYRYLLQKNLIKPNQQHSELPQIECHSPIAVHEQWEMDAKGREYVADIGVISLIDLNDRKSHARLLSYPCYLGKKRAIRYPQTQDYQSALRLSFTDWGLPDCIGVDHDPVFYDNETPSPFPTRLHLWLIGLGVALCFGRKGRPIDQAMTERSHQLWQKQVIQGQHFDNFDQLYWALNHRRAFLNNTLPCSSLDNQPITKTFPELTTPRRVYSPHLEAEIFQVERIYQYLSDGHWFRKVAENGTVGIGRKVYGVGISWAKEQIQITFELDRKQYKMFNPANQEVKYFDLKGCLKEELMGELPVWKNLKGLQLSLPFTYNEWRVSRLCETLG